MADRPILFSAPMIRALLDGRKTQTRRTLKPQPSAPAQCGNDWVDGAVERHRGSMDGERLINKYSVGDRAWVREGWAFMPKNAYDLPKTIVPHDPDTALYYRAGFDRSGKQRWHPSIHMPRWASRLTLIVSEVRVPRLQEISSADTIAEGVECETCRAMGRSACNLAGCFASRQEYRTLWDSINGAGAWDRNPWVAAYSFTVHHCNIDAMKEPT